MKFFILRLKNVIIPFFIYVFTVFLLLYSSDNLIAAKNGVSLWALSIVPSMLPFFIATELLFYTNIINLLGNFLNKLMKPIFNVPGEGAFALLMGIISGYPIGAKIVCNLKSQNICTDIECERLISFTNNSSPLFIIGTVGIGMLGNQSLGYKLFIVHILSCLLVGFTFRFWKKSKESSFISVKRNNGLSNGAGLSHPLQYSTNSPIKISNLGIILSEAIQISIKSVLIIGGFIVFFSVVISMLTNSKILNIVSTFLTPIFKILHIPNSFSSSIIIGLIEVTNGLKVTAIPNNNISIIICSFLLGFGGLSILLQILSITSKAKISIRPYVLGKILHSTFSAILMWILLL